MCDIEHILRHYDLCRVLLATKKLQSGAGYVDTAGYVDVPLNHPQPPSITPILAKNCHISAISWPVQTGFMLKKSTVCQDDMVNYTEKEFLLEFVD